jgi:hypothetical protein
MRLGKGRYERALEDIRLGISFKHRPESWGTMTSEQRNEWYLSKRAVQAVRKGIARVRRP